METNDVTQQDRRGFLQVAGAAKGIIDPTKVVRIALQDAASIAGLLITTIEPNRRVTVAVLRVGGGCFSR